MMVLELYVHGQAGQHKAHEADTQDGGVHETAVDAGEDVLVACAGQCLFIRSGYGSLDDGEGLALRHGNDESVHFFLLLSAKTQNLAYAHMHTHTSLEK